MGLPFPWRIHRPVKPLSALVLTAVATLAAAAENPLKVTLVAEEKVIAPGATFHLGLHLEAPTGHHTYWKHPGIVGLATRVRWTLPAGFTAGEIQWPAPEAVRMARYTAQGYRGETLLIVPVTAPAEMTETTATLTAHASWMCCGERCHPAVDVPFTITLPVAARPAADPARAGLFSRFRARLPVRDDAWQVKVERAPGILRLILSSRDPAITRDVASLGEVRFFTADGQVDSNRAQHVTRSGDHLSIDLPATSADGGPPRGVLVAARSWRREGPSSVALELP
jgi:thiol:disulfide interchange protein DsbD